VLQAEACNTDTTPTQPNKIASDVKLVFYSSTGLKYIFASTRQNETHNLVQDPHLRCGLVFNPLSIVFHTQQRKLQGPTCPEMKLSTAKSGAASRCNRLRKRVFV